MGKNFKPEALTEFARYYGFHYDRIDPYGLVDDVLVQMEEGLKGKISCLPMIPAYISPVSKITPGKTVIALDAGGTNLRSALVNFDEKGKALILDSLKAPMPGSNSHVNKEEFFEEIASLTKPHLEKAKNDNLEIEGIGFCFSYPMDITEKADGILRMFTKEVDAPEVIGSVIGESLKAALEVGGIKAPEKIILLNDTAATLLSGLAEMPIHGGQRRVEDPYAMEAGPMLGFILGTGFNTAYPETCIPKIDFFSPEHPQIVVCESGNFAHRYMGILDKEFDQSTKNPGTYFLEKAASGAYLGPLTHIVIKQALDEGLFTFAKADEFISWPVLHTKDVNQFMHEPLSPGVVADLFDRSEMEAKSSFMYLTSIVTERAALLSAGVLAAAMEKACKNYHSLDPLIPVRVAVEGTTYAIYKGMRRALEAHLHLMFTRRNPRSYALVQVEQASLMGAAVAALA